MTHIPFVKQSVYFISYTYVESFVSRESASVMREDRRQAFGNVIIEVPDDTELTAMARNMEKALKIAQGTLIILFFNRIGDLPKKEEAPETPVEETK